MGQVEIKEAGSDGESCPPSDLPPFWGQLRRGDFHLNPKGTQTPSQTTAFFGVKLEGFAGTVLTGGTIHSPRNDISLGRAFRFVEISPFLCGTTVDSPVEFQQDAYRGGACNILPYYWAPRRGKESVRDR